MKNRDLNPFHGHRTGVLKIKDTLNLLKPPHPCGAFAYSLLGCLSNIKNKDNKFSPALSLSFFFSISVTFPFGAFRLLQFILCPETATSKVAG